MTRRDALSAGLVVLGVALLVGPALVPVQPVLYHDTRPGIEANASQIAEMERQGYTVVSYGTLSERGQQLYVRTLRNDGEYTVPVGEGADEFDYPTDADLADAERRVERRRLEMVVVERPPDADLPPPDEQLEAAEFLQQRYEERRNGTNVSVEELRRQIARYDAMEARTGAPPRTSPPVLGRFLAALGGVVALGTGGYLRSLP